MQCCCLSTKCLHSAPQQSQLVPTLPPQVDSGDEAEEAPQRPSQRAASQRRAAAAATAAVQQQQRQQMDDSEEEEERQVGYAWVDSG